MCLCWRHEPLTEFPITLFADGFPSFARSGRDTVTNVQLSAVAQCLVLKCTKAQLPTMINHVGRTVNLPEEQEGKEAAHKEHTSARRRHVCSTLQTTWLSASFVAREAHERERCDGVVLCPATCERANLNPSCRQRLGVSAVAS